MNAIRGGVRAVAWAALGMTTVGCFSAPPILEHLYPAGAERGTTNLVRLTGKFDPWPPQVWVSAPGVAFQAETNKGTFRVAVAASAGPGPRLVRLYNEEGASDPRFFVVGRHKEIMEVEPNDLFSKPQPVAELPVTVNGRLDKKGDVDSFAVRMKAGQWLDARVDAYTLMSKLDALLRLVSTNGQPFAWNHDFVTLDPRLVWETPSDQTIIVQLMGFAYPANAEVALAGGEGAVYRLHLEVRDEPPPDLFPLSTEQEPNDTSDTAQPIELSATILGAISSAEDEDRFRFKLDKDQSIEARVEAASLGSPLDAWLKIEDSAGKELVRNDDAEGSRDPLLEWKSPNAGAYIVVVGSLTHRGGEDSRYRLELRAVGPDFKTSLSGGALLLPAGRTNELKVTVKRLRGFTNDLAVAFRDLPAGVTARESSVSPQGGDVSIKVVAATNAPAFNGPVRLLVADKISKIERAVPLDLVNRSENNGVPGGYTRLLIDQTDQLWLTVRPFVPHKNEAAAK